MQSPASSIVFTSRLLEHRIHSQPRFQFLELAVVLIAGGMDVLGLGDEFHLVVAGHVAPAEHLFKRAQFLAVGDQ